MKVTKKQISKYAAKIGQLGGLASARAKGNISEHEYRVRTIEAKRSGMSKPSLTAYAGKSNQQASSSQAHLSSRHIRLVNGKPASI